MNERIDQLLWQAGGFNKISNPNDSFLDGKYILSQEQLDKFAELIVRQCAYYADVFSALECPVDMDPTETKPSDYIKREMGITE